MTAFDALAQAFAAKLAEAPAVSANVVLDQPDEDALPDTGSGITIMLTSSEPQQLGNIRGNPVDWITEVRMRCWARAAITSARPAANALAAAAYARLAADPSLGLGAGVFVGEPRIEWDVDHAERRYAAANLAYSVRHRTSSLTLE